MPTYEYVCTECGERLEVVQGFSDDPLTVCPACQGKLRKVFSPVGVVFKGSGFYKTDSRSTKASPAAASSTPAAAKAGDSGGTSGGGSGGGEGTTGSSTSSSASGDAPKSSTSAQSGSAGSPPSTGGTSKVA